MIDYCHGGETGLWMPLEKVGVRVIRREKGSFGETMTMAELSKKMADAGCMLYHIHAVTNSSYLDDELIAEFLRHHYEWSKDARDTCFFILHPLSPRDLPRVSWTDDESKLISQEKRDVMDRYRARYDMLLTLLTAIEKNHFSRYFPWITYSDIDIVFTRAFTSPYTLMQRLMNQHYNLTTEATYCGDGNIQPCDNEFMELATGNKRDVAFVVATDQFPFTQAVLNSGVMLVTVSRVARFVLQATLSIFNITLPTHSFDDLDQGRLSYVLQETFDLNHDYIRSLFAPLNETILKPACSEDQILMIRRFNLNKALNHPLFKNVARAIFPEGKLSEHEDNKIAVVCSKWMNSPACMEPGRLARRQMLTGFTCGDFAAHFYGCGKDTLFSSTWRQEIAKLECRSYLRWDTNSDGTPFDWTTFLKEVRPISHDGGVFEPLVRPWLMKPSPGGRCDSWDCVTWGLENSPRHTDKPNQYRYAGSEPEIPYYG